ncbi:ABC transporter permease [Paraflavisolibacter sp. H34]|uniref:ABC transporter permease n=1 Tax=Huijunlia imazamoxiresistens TaxID=3127457 RepID=UPI003015A98F
MINTAELQSVPGTQEKKTQPEEWTEIIQPRTSLFDLRLQELWRYKDLVLMFVRRDFVANYKQTILGPIWFFLQPLLTTLTYVLIFGQVAKISTDGLPMMLFYLAGITIWNYFSETLTKTATVFKDNAAMFGKVYFPRLTAPFSIVISNLLRFLIQFGLFISVWCYYYFQGDVVHPNLLVLLTPCLVLLMGLMALGMGMMISAMTTKYRDLIFLLTFGVQLLMYATPVIYPLSSLPEKYKWVVLLNPMTSIVETFRYAYLGVGSFEWSNLGISLVETMLILVIGILVFNKVEKSFTDTM